MAEDKGRSSTTWMVAGLFVGFLLCLCVAALAAGAAFLWRRGAATPGSPTAPALTLPAPAVTLTPTAPPEAGDPIPEEARRMAETLASVEVPIADPIDITERLRGLSGIPRVLAEVADPIPVGTVRTFWASNVDQNTNFQVQAELVYATDHVYFWVQQGVDYDLKDVQALVDEFEERIYPTNRAFFGTEWTPGVDGDPHLYMLFARGLGSGIAGYFASNDSYPPEVHEYSNGHEMFYLSADNLDLADEFTLGVLAHEFQHMIHWYQDRNEETWMNEGFSEVAVLINGYEMGGFDRRFASSPDLTLTYWPSASGSSIAHYGQSFLFLTYFLDRFGAEATQALVAQEANGLDSIDRTLAQLGATDPSTGAPLTADDLYRDWAVALLLNDPSLEDGRFALRSHDPAPVGISERIDTCPAERDLQVNPYGIDYIRIRCPGDHTLRFEGQTLTQVVPGDPHSGDYAFWSNRGDESDMTLTRAFDFSGVRGPITFDYWVWYDIEEGYDYLYLEASTDGGRTWQILTTPSGTDEDPSGNSYGWAYNGVSGDGARPTWIQESVDLSDFAGQEVLLRFEYVTDAAVNGEGLLLDDLRIEAIDYFEDFETGDGGWEARGWVRLYNRIPQNYSLVLVEKGREIRVRDLSLDQARRAEVDFTVGDGVEEVYLIVINTTRHTWQASPYRISIDP